MIGSADQGDLDAANSGLSGDALMALATPHLDVLASSGVEHCLVSVGAAGVIHGGKAMAVPCLYPATPVDAEHASFDPTPRCHWCAAPPPPRPLFTMPGSQ